MSEVPLHSRLKRNRLLPLKARKMPIYETCPVIKVTRDLFLSGVLVTKAPYWEVVSNAAHDSCKSCNPLLKLLTFLVSSGTAGNLISQNVFIN